MAHRIRKRRRDLGQSSKVMQASTLLPRADVKRRLLQVSRVLEAFATSSYGPLGGVQLVQANAQCADALTLTSVAERYLASIKIDDCPIANAYFHILRSKLRGHADAGLFLTGFSARYGQLGTAKDQKLATELRPQCCTSTNSSLQLEIQEGRLAHIPHHLVERGLQLALQWCMEYLDDPCCPVRISVDWSSEASLCAVIRSIVSTKSTAALDEASTDAVVIPLVLQSFISVFQYVLAFPDQPIPIKFLFAPGQKSIDKSQVWKQSVLLDLAWPTRSRHAGTKRGSLSPPLCNLRVALFNITVEPLPELDAEGSGGKTSMRHTGSLADYRLEALRQVGDRLQQLGVTAVLSQKLIPKYLQTYLASKDIFTLDRLSRTHIRSVEMLSGATILGDWMLGDDVTSDSLGFLSLVTTQTFGTKRYIRLHRDDETQAQRPPVVTELASSSRCGPVTTIALAAPDRYAYDELCHVLTVAFKTLAELLKNPDALAGAGCTEVHLAAAIRHRASQLVPILTATTEKAEPWAAERATQTARTLRQLRQTLEVFGEGLEAMAGRLCGPDATATERATMLERLRVANSHSLSYTNSKGDPEQQESELFGWDPCKRAAVCVLDHSFQQDEETGERQEECVRQAHVLDALQPKKDALVLSVECASSLLRVASVVNIR